MHVFNEVKKNSFDNICILNIQTDLIINIINFFLFINLYYYFPIYT